MKHKFTHMDTLNYVCDAKTWSLDFIDNTLWNNNGLGSILHASNNLIRFFLKKGTHCM